MSITKIYILFITSIVSFNLSGQSCYIDNISHYNYHDVKVILDNNKCNTCHSSSNNRSNWNYENYEAMFTLNSCGYQIITPGKPSSSAIIDKLNGGPTACGFPMPLGQESISNKDLLAIESWINVGAPENCVAVYSDIKYTLDQKKCNSCHNGNSVWSYDTYESMFVKPKSSSCPTEDIIKYDANNSLIFKKLNHASFCGNTSLATESQLNTTEVAMIRDWINAGAPNQKSSLPVQLSSFNTKNNDNLSISIYWSTESEQNTSHFELEHSMDGITFAQVAVISTQATSPDAKYYSYRHEAIEVGFNYYRLKFVDFDQSTNYSPVRVERVKNVTEIFNTYPNPVYKNHALSIEWYPIDERSKSQVTICNFLGFEVKKVNINFGINTIQTDELIPGLYYLTIKDYDEQIISSKLVVL